MKNASPPVDEFQDLEMLTQENLRLRGDLLTVATRIHHDLRTPLGSITATGEIIKEGAAGNNPALTSLVASIFSAADEIARLLERVGAVLKATVSSIPKGSVVMGQPVSAAMQRLERRILAGGALITLPSSWPEVSGVARWLEIVWWNFLANALDHAGAAARIQLGWRETGREIRFWVDDDGEGVSPGTRTRLFQPFNTLHEMNSTRGLGLSIVQRLIELQGGSCGYEPIPDGGARFYFTLPVESPTTPAT
jgi:signal transduction histidine kinase